MDLKVNERLVEERTESGLKIWACTECSFSRPGKWDVQRHIEQKHLGLYIQCHICQATFTRRDKHRAHVKKHAYS